MASLNNNVNNFLKKVLSTNDELEFRVIIRSNNFKEAYIEK